MWRHRAGKIGHPARRFFALRKHRREEGGIRRHHHPSTFDLANDFDIDFGHRFAKVKVDDVTTQSVEHGDQLVERPTDVDV